MAEDFPTIESSQTQREVRQVIRLITLFFGVFGIGLVVIFLFYPQGRKPQQPEAISESHPSSTVTRTPMRGELILLVEAPLPPSHFALNRGGVELCSASELGQIFNVEVQNFELPWDGINLVVRARWDEHLPGPRALRITANLGEERLGEAVFWGEGESLEANWHLVPEME